MGALLACARRTVAMILPRSVLRPTLVARRIAALPTEREPEKTSSPATFSTGIGSPVILLSSKAPSERRMPSTGTRSPLRSITSSPTLSSFISRRTKLSPTFTIASCGARDISLRSESVVRLLARSSMYRPRRIKVMIIPMTSK